MTGRRGVGVLRFVSVSLLGVALLAATVASNSLTPRTWGAGECHLDWCRPQAAPSTNIDAALQEAADVARLSADHGCIPADDARPGVIPAEMVLRQPGGTVARAAWTYPAPEGSWVWALCYGD